MSIPFYLKNAPTGPVTLKILREHNGTTEDVRTFAMDTSGSGAAAASRRSAEAADVAAARRRATAAQGANTFVWDFRYAGANVIPDAVFQGQAAGPLAASGNRIASS